MGNDQSRREQHPTCKFPAGPEVVVWNHGRKNKDNVMISDMFSYLINYVEFTRGKLRIARDTTVNDLCYNGVKCLGPSFTHTSLTNDTCDLSDYA